MAKTIVLCILLYSLLNFATTNTIKDGAGVVEGGRGGGGGGVKDANEATASDHGSMSGIFSKKSDDQCQGDTCVLDEANKPLNGDSNINTSEKATNDDNTSEKPADDEKTPAKPADGNIAPEKLSDDENDDISIPLGDVFGPRFQKIHLALPRRENNEVEC